MSLRSRAHLLSRALNSVDQVEYSLTWYRIAKTDLKRLRSELADLRRSDEESPPELLQQIVPLLDKTPASCRRLRPDAFAAIVEVLAHAGKQDLRSRGLFLLAVSCYCPFAEVAC